MNREGADSKLGANLTFKLRSRTVGEKDQGFLQTQTDVVATVFLGLRVARFNHLLTADRTSSNSESLEIVGFLFSQDRGFVLVAGLIPAHLAPK